MALCAIDLHRWAVRRLANDLQPHEEHNEKRQDAPHWIGEATDDRTGGVLTYPGGDSPGDPTSQGAPRPVEPVVWNDALHLRQNAEPCDDATSVLVGYGLQAAETVSWRVEF